MTFKIDLRPGTKLSEHYTNRRDNYKVVEVDNALGYVVSGGSRGGAAGIYPLYQADIYLKVGKTWHIVSSYEQGARLNDYTFHTDYEGCTFAMIAAQAINALQERRHIQELAQQAKKKVGEKPRRGDRRSSARKKAH